MTPTPLLRAAVRRVRLNVVADHVRRRTKRTQAYAMRAFLRQRIKRSGKSLVGSHPVVVSLTSYGARVAEVAITIESIGRGSTRPARLILWLDEQDTLDNLPSDLLRQRSRGLEIRPTEDVGPHKKYFPYVMSERRHVLPLATADDDVIYPRSWLRLLVEANRQFPTAVSCYRANIVCVEGDKLAPYNSWPRCRNTVASATRFATGVSGVIYPPTMLEDLARRGDAFRSTTPRADDVWLHWVALRTSRPVRQLSSRPRHFPLIPGSQNGGLTTYNVYEHGNDRQIAALYTPADIEALERAGA